MTCVFSEAVLQFDEGNIEIKGGQLRGLQNIQQKTQMSEGTTLHGTQAQRHHVYSFEVVPFATAGVVNVRVREGGCLDVARNPSLASNTLTLTYDSSNPTATITLVNNHNPNALTTIDSSTNSETNDDDSSTIPHTNANTLQFSVVFSEPVKGKFIASILVYGLYNI